MKRVLLLALLVSLMLVPAAEAAEQGIYYSGKDAAALDWVHSAGLSFVIAPPSHALEQQLAARGMTAVWNVPFRRANPALIAEYDTSPVTRGWYIADEPSLSEGGALRWWNNTVHSMSHHPTYSVHWGCDKTQVHWSMSPFKDGADWIGTDCYPVGVSSSRIVGPAFKEGARITKRWGKQFWAVIQAASWEAMGGVNYGRPETQWPTAREMQIMRDCALKRTNTVVWYSFKDVLKGGQGALDRLGAAIRSPRRKCPPNK